MKIVIFGLTVSSSWGNGHATLWRGLCRALAARGHHVVFFERDQPFYAGARDLTELPGGGRLHLYCSFNEIRGCALRELHDADLSMTTSYCPDGREAAALVLDSNSALKAFYDLDTPVTLDRLNHGDFVDYLPAAGLAEFDFALSYTGGRALVELRQKLGAIRAFPLYGSVDPQAHFPVTPSQEYRSDLSYLGTYAQDRQPALEKLFIAPARVLRDRRFLIGGAQYPQDFPWSPNIFFVRHMPPPMHPLFFSSSRATLNVTRSAMAQYGYCPSGRLFEAAACGAPLLSDTWEGLDTFFRPGEELLAVESSEDVEKAMQLEDAELRRLAWRARERTLDEHTATVRVRQLESICDEMSGVSPGTAVELAS